MGKPVFAALSLALLLCACGDSGGGKSAPAAGPPAGSSAASPGMATQPEPGTASPPADPAAKSWTGTLEKMGPSIHMEGTHRLVEGGKTVVLLKSAKVDLSKSEGKRVTVTGTASPTVEGNATIVTVDTVTP